MTVKCLTLEEQNTIAAVYREKLFSINDLATMYGYSRRTIIRVLNAANVDTGIKPKTKKVPQPVPVVIPTRRPWYRRLFTGVTWPSISRGIGE